MLRTPIRDCRWSWLAGNSHHQRPKLPKWHTVRDAGHEFPDSGLSQSEPQIIDVMGKKWPFWPGHWCCVLAIVACLMLTGCAGVSSGGSQPNSNPPPKNDPPPSMGQLSVAPTALDFGTVALGGSSKLTGTLTAATSDVNVTSAAWNGQGYSVSGITFPVKVAAGTSVNYTVTFTPEADGNSAGKISFVNDGATSPVVETLDGGGGQAGAHTVGLSWGASTSSVIGYNVYRGTQSGGPYQRLTPSPQLATSYTDTTVLTGTTYYYVATAVDSDLAESVYSNQAQAVIP
jgi:hypothetical protein